MTFGTMPSGERVERFELSSGPLRAAVLSYGAVLQTLEVYGLNVVLGLDTLDDYLTRSRYFGAVAGRYANRIAGGRFALDGTEYQVPVNDGPNSLHGGVHGFDSKVWTVADVTGSSITLTLTSPDGDQGYPGTLNASVTYTLEAEAIRLDYTAETDAPTVLNLTNHSYFNLAGRGDVLGHVVRIDAEHYLPVDAVKIPTGELAPVKGTPFDFTEPHAIGERQGGAYDHCFVLDGGVTVVEPETGRTMEVTTTEPGVQFYAGGMLDPAATPYGPHAGLCLETQHFPDSPNQPGFPSTVLRPGERFTSSTTYRFTG
ncbi:aldose epimerase family protein [Nonomuraea cavernae]|uniref:Aldose 1-epimerase n=1 Tax=Nonomuraea cavernae TaxID=2045107 RepID=A0A917YT21_9ACTN|nr:aldose epimerase family protein [Nonomuraea cavernae]MCA2185272.1 galactose mutarotase [Nonomuraea cavernae]GGO65958.1 aldose 1-epimerase [Nonomuraea cavernae]